MVSRSKHAFAIASLVATGGLLASSCTEDGSQLFIRGVLLPDNETCLVKVDSEAVTLSQGLLDTAYASQYSAAILVGNQMVGRGDEDLLRTETSRIHLREADVTIDFETGESFTYTVSVSGFVDPGEAGSPGWGFTSVLLIDPESADALDCLIQRDATMQRVDVTVLLRGETLGENTFESFPWTFPINVCRGCTCVVPPAADDPATDDIDCEICTEEPTNSCSIGINEAFDCRLRCSCAPNFRPHDGTGACSPG